jgi:tRNA1Val (adenine37-N6)-methyltransferase
MSEAVGLCMNEGMGIKRLRLIHPSASKEANLVLIEAVKGYSGSNLIEPPLIVYREDGQYSQELWEIYFGG